MADTVYTANVFSKMKHVYKNATNNITHLICNKFYVINLISLHYHIYFYHIICTHYLLLREYITYFDKTIYVVKIKLYKFLISDLITYCYDFEQSIVYYTSYQDS